MKHLILLVAAFLMIQVVYSQKEKTDMKANSPLEIDKLALRDAGDKNNNFYDNEETYLLPVKDLVVEGEVENPGKVDFSKLTKRSVIVKETLLNKDTGNQFVGAYRYDGYSLFDILKDRILKKKNAAEFKPIIDVFVIIENDLGEKVVMSWGEIYYPNILHNAIIATSVMRIVPSKSKDLWPLPVASKLVIGNDLITERNIRNPIRITVVSYPGKYTVNRDLSPLVSGHFDLVLDGKIKESVEGPMKQFQTETLHTIFYGKGRGIHSTTPFSGIFLKDYISREVTEKRKDLREGLVIMAGIDGYRSVYTLSEIINRNDQSDVLLVPCPDEKDGGKFRIFPSCDFFSDRAVKALSEIRIETRLK